MYQRVKRHHASEAQNRGSDLMDEASRIL